MSTNVVAPSSAAVVADVVFPTQATATARYSAMFGTRTRFVLMVLVLLCLTSIWSNILSFNFAVICMAPKNETDSRPDRHLYTHSEKSWAISVVAIAALLANFPVVTLVNKIGIRMVFASLGILSAVSTLLVPVAIRMTIIMFQLGFPWFLATRALQGVAFAANFPVIGAFCAKWTYFKQNGLFVSALVAYVQLSPAFTMPVSGALCENFRWPSVFYAHGTISLVLFILYGLLYRNNPSKHPMVGSVELKKISLGKINVDKRALAKIPYGPILRTPAVWAVWLASLGNFFCVNMMFLYSPVYMVRVLGFEVTKTGISAALPPLSQFMMKLFVGAMSDRVKFISEIWKFRILNSIAFFGCAIGMVVLAFLGVEHPNVNVIVLGASAAALGATTGGFYKASPTISKQYSHFVTGNISLGLTITMLIIPFVVNGLTPTNAVEEWRYVFLVTAAILVVSNLIFLVFIKAEPCEWTQDEFVKRFSRPKIMDSRCNTAVSIEQHF